MDSTNSVSLGRQLNPWTSLSEVLHLSNTSNFYFPQFCHISSKVFKSNCFLQLHICCADMRVVLISQTSRQGGEWAYFQKWRGVAQLKFLSATYSSIKHNTYRACGVFTRKVKLWSEEATLTRQACLDCTAWEEFIESSWDIKPTEVVSSWVSYCEGILIAGRALRIHHHSNGITLGEQTPWSVIKSGEKNKPLLPAKCFTKRD